MEFMKERSLVCPKCGATLEIEDGLDMFYCKYCGNRIVLEGQSKVAYRAKTKVKQMEHDERMVDKKHNQERYIIQQKAKTERNEMLVVALIIGGMILLPFVNIARGETKSKQQEAELQQLVVQVQEDIKNGDFDDAYIKAKQIQYTEGWSNDVEEKWDDIRRSLIDQIISTEKQVTGKSDHKPEKKGWFD